jgi:hypothetical protein
MDQYRHIRSIPTSSKPNLMVFPVDVEVLFQFSWHSPNMDVGGVVEPTEGYG